MNLSRTSRPYLGPALVVDVLVPPALALSSSVPLGGAVDNNSKFMVPGQPTTSLTLTLRTRHRFLSSIIKLASPDVLVREVPRGGDEEPGEEHPATEAIFVVLPEWATLLVVAVLLVVKLGAVAGGGGIGTRYVTLLLRERGSPSTTTASVAPQDSGIIRRDISRLGVARGDRVFPAHKTAPRCRAARGSVRDI
jgi:hypothetical protein